MKKGFPGMGGGFNMQQMIQQAQKMQQQMQAAQDQLKEEEVEASAGGGMVKVVASGDKVIKSISIEPEAIDPDDKEMLEDLVLAAVNEALNKAEALNKEIMGKATGGLNTGGLF